MDFFFFFQRVWFVLNHSMGTDRVCIFAKTAFLIVDFDTMDYENSAYDLKSRAMWKAKTILKDFVYILLSYERIDSMCVSGDYLYFIFWKQS